MTSKERIYARLRGEKVDKIPNLCIIMQFAAQEYGVPYGTYVTDYKVLAAAAYECCEKYGIDLLCAISDPMREAEGFGAKVVIPENGVPYAAEPLIKELADIAKLRVIDPINGRRMNDRLEAVRLLCEKSAGQHSVCGWVEGALAESCDLRDLNNLFIDICDEPETVHQLLEICTQQSILFAQAQIAAGADMVGIGDAAASLIGPALYEEFAFPYEKRIVDAIHAAGAIAKLHICGNIEPILPLVAQTGADIVDCDHMVPLSKAAAICKGSISGNFDPVEILLHGSADTVRSAVRDCISQGNDRIMVAAGCEVPIGTPPENMREVNAQCTIN